MVPWAASSAPPKARKRQPWRPSWCWRASGKRSTTSGACGLLRVDAYAASTDDFLQQPAVVDGASEVFITALAERGKRPRTAFGMPRLPLDNSVTLVVTFAYDGP